MKHNPQYSIPVPYYHCNYHSKSTVTVHTAGPGSEGPPRAGPTRPTPRPGRTRPADGPAPALDASAANRRDGDVEGGALPQLRAARA